MNKTFDQVFRQAYKDMTMITYDTKDKYDQRHGGAFDRGSADSYYGRPRRPHFYVGDTMTSEMVTESNMTPSEIQAYIAGYQWNEQFGDKKQWA